MPIFDKIAPSFQQNMRPLYQFGHTAEALDNQFELLQKFTKHAEINFSKVKFKSIFSNKYFAIAILSILMFYCSTLGENC